MGFEIKRYLNNRGEAEYIECIEDLIQFCSENMSEYIDLSEYIFKFSDPLFRELNIDMEDSKCELDYSSLDRDLRRIMLKNEYQQKDEDALLQILQTILSKVDSLTEKIATPIIERRKRLISFERTVL